MAASQSLDELVTAEERRQRLELAIRRLNDLAARTNTPRPIAEDIILVLTKIKSLKEERQNTNAEIGKFLKVIGYE